MLDLQRASAGSGKTYALAKKYIWYLITIRPEGERKRRLRTNAEIADSAQHILAVTFTNKATNEMQMRIVDKLFALAYPRDGKSPDYMEEFCRDLGVSPAEISRVCQYALVVLLNDYSEFNVSTIDSFFQQVLRTFAYETDNNSSFQVELDSKYLSQLSVDATLEEIDSEREKSVAYYWIRHLIKSADSGKWNPFQRPEAAANGRGGKNIYQDIIAALVKLDNEQYKIVRRDVEDYLKTDVDLPALYEELDRKYLEPVKLLFDEMVEKARILYELLPETAQTASGNSDVGKLAQPYKKVAKGIGPKEKWKWSEVPKSSLPVFDDAFFAKKKVVEFMTPLGAEAGDIVRAAHDFETAFQGWISAMEEEDYANWSLCRENFPYFGLFSIANRKRREYLEENNAIELGETPLILSSIIDDSDAPFIYERMGTKLNHFLIDEFQDTSRLQWKNLRPLLHESMSRDNDNLIIGDAKQSIYRFRNADPSLITDVVPGDFAGKVNELGNAPAENTNWRSDLRVVEFNNTFFRFLAEKLDSVIREERGKLGKIDFEKLYGNVVQTPSKQAPRGYVEINFVPTAKGKKGDDDGDDETAEAKRAALVPPLVADLIGRGYRQKDIAVLVKTKNQGLSVIEKLMEHNDALPEDSRPISFVSEESLKLKSSRAVMIVTGVLENVARGSSPEIKEKEERKHKGVGNWRELQTNFKFFAMQHPDKPIADVLDEFIDEGAGEDALHQMLLGMQSVSLPALVEAAVATFVPESLRHQDAVFIAAFQDLVLEYCDSHPTDIASFLKWWDRKQRDASISSPEGADAVQVMTLHKSKGLEFKCVIVPFADWDFAEKVKSNQIEWRWVKPIGFKSDCQPLPPYLPVNVTQRMATTSYAPLLTEYFDMRKMDFLNEAYVAFTRASSELYVFSALKEEKEGKSPKKNSKTTAGPLEMGNLLKEFFSEERDDGSDIALLPWDVVEWHEEEHRFTVGLRQEKVETPADNVGDRITIEDYSAHPTPDFLKYREEILPDVVDVEDIEDVEEIEDSQNPRSEGNVKHAVLEGVKVMADLPRAVRRIVLSGLISESEGVKILGDLTVRLSRPAVAGWFDGKAKVINERALLKQDERMLRPDRVMVYPGNRAVVVDYKFGSSSQLKKHRWQVKRYMKLLRETGMFATVAGYIWYVNEDRIEPA